MCFRAWLDHFCSRFVLGASFPLILLSTISVSSTSIILVSLFFNLHPMPLGPAGPHNNLKNSPWRIGSVDHVRSSRAPQCSCIHERWKIDFPHPGLHPLLSPLFMRHSVCVALETLIAMKHASKCLPAIYVCVCVCVIPAHFWWIMDLNKNPQRY